MRLFKQLVSHVLVLCLTAVMVVTCQQQTHACCVSSQSALSGGGVEPSRCHEQLLPQGTATQNDRVVAKCCLVQQQVLTDTATIRAFEPSDAYIVQFIAYSIAPHFLTTPKLTAQLHQRVIPDESRRYRQLQVFLL